MPPAARIEDKGGTKGEPVAGGSRGDSSEGWGRGRSGSGGGAIGPDKIFEASFAESVLDAHAGFVRACTSMPEMCERERQATRCAPSDQN